MRMSLSKFIDRHSPMYLLGRFMQSQTYKTFAVFASVNMIVAIIQGLAGLLQARWVTSEVLGEFNKYGILTSYLALGTVFVQDGFVRQYSYFMGKGMRDEAISIASIAKTWYVIIAVISSLFFITMSLRSFFVGDYVAVAGWGAQCVAIIGSSYGIYMQTVYRRSLEFKRLSWNGLVASIVAFALLILVKVWGYYGLALRMVFTNIIRMFYDARYIPEKIRMSWNWDRFVSLVKISVPLSIEGYIRTSFLSATFGYLVLKYCSEKDLGLYGIAMSFEMFAMIFVTSLIQIFDVKMANKFGETDSILDSMKMLVKPVIIGVGISLLCLMVLCVCIAPFIRNFLPNYLDAIGVVYVLSISLPLGALMIPVRLLRVALRYKSIYCIAIVRLLTLIISVHFVPQTIEWFAGCKVLSEFVSIACGYGLLVCFICHSKKLSLCHA